MNQADLFPIDRHDAGGRVKSALPPGLKGDAVFYGERDEYRPLLRRWIGDEFPSRYVLFIGHNPSTADSNLNDPTITREWGFASRWSYDGYAKCNIVDYRATFPKDLLKPGLELSSPRNLQTILEQAQSADKVVICCGNPNKATTRSAYDVLAELWTAGIALKAFKVNGTGYPAHPLYLRSDTPLIDF